MTSIEQASFDEFMRNYKEGKMGSMRLGQAFYNTFKLEKMVDKHLSLNKIYYEASNKKALGLIRETFLIH